MPYASFTLECSSEMFVSRKLWNPQASSHRSTDTLRSLKKTKRHIKSTHGYKVCDGSGRLYQSPEYWHAALTGVDRKTATSTTIAAVGIEVFVSFRALFVSGENRDAVLCFSDSPRLVMRSFHSFPFGVQIWRFPGVSMATSPYCTL